MPTTRKTAITVARTRMVQRNRSRLTRRETCRVHRLYQTDAPPTAVAMDATVRAGT
jgi:hypothetical protein